MLRTLFVVLALMSGPVLAQSQRRPPQAPPDRIEPPPNIGRAYPEAKPELAQPQREEAVCVRECQALQLCGG